MGYEILIAEIKNAYEVTEQLEQNYKTVQKSNKEADLLLEKYKQKLKNLQLKMQSQENDLAKLKKALPQYEENHNNLKNELEACLAGIAEINKHIQLFKMLCEINTENGIESVNIDMTLLEQVNTNRINLAKIKLFSSEYRQYQEDKTILETLHKKLEDITQQEANTKQQFEQAKKALEGKRLPYKGWFGWQNLDGADAEETKIRHDYSRFEVQLEKISQDKNTINEQIQQKSAIIQNKRKDLISILNDLYKLRNDIGQLILTLEQELESEQAKKEMLDEKLKSIEGLLKNKQETGEKINLELQEMNREITSIESGIVDQKYKLETLTTELKHAEQKLEFNKSQHIKLAEILSQMGINVSRESMVSLKPQAKTVPNLLPLFSKSKEERVSELELISKSSLVKGNKEENKARIAYIFSRKLPKTPENVNKKETSSSKEPKEKHNSLKIDPNFKLKLEKVYKK